MPIAIVGRGCVLPGALSPGALWDKLQAGTDLLSRPPPGAWPVDSDLITLDTAGLRWSDRGGYVDGFRFDPSGYAMDPEELLAADRCAQWVLQASRAALVEAGYDPKQGHRRTGAILGHLSLPLPAQTRFAIDVWLRQWAQAQGQPELAESVAPRKTAAFNRYMSALPTRLLARALGLGCEAFTLDAACASSLYAIKLACDTLADERADLMLAGAVCGTDPMFLHIGFRALKALSPTGQSRPFDQHANGLVPAEGAVVIALKRLVDAESAGDRILGVIHGVGLSNDGGAAGMLVPTTTGQVRAMRQALDVAGLAPTDLDLLECHATGTPLGDAIELASIGQVYQGCDGLAIGSLKSQMGHLLTVSGGAALLRILSAYIADRLPRSRSVDTPIDGLAQAPVRLLDTDEPWPAGSRRLAGVSSFGFGGNNAHLLVGAYERMRPGKLHRAQPKILTSNPLAVVGLGVVGGRAQDVHQFIQILRSGEDALQDHPHLGRCGVASDFSLGPKEIRFPPRDLADSLPQQLLLLKAVHQAIGKVRNLPPARTGILVGMECDPEIARHMARCLVPAWTQTWVASTGSMIDAAWVKRMCDGFSPDLKASVVTGSLPNIVANRINAQFKLEGTSYSVCADELSGLRAMEIASRALHHGDLDVAIVAAVDLACEPVSAEAARALQGRNRETPGDAAVVLILKRLEDAKRDGDEVLAALDTSSRPDTPDADADATTFQLGDAPGAFFLNERFGHAHAACGLLQVAGAIVACQQGFLPGPGPASPWLTRSPTRHACVDIHGQGNQHGTVHVASLAGEPSRTFIDSRFPDPGDTPSGIRFVSHPPRVNLPAWEGGRIVRSWCAPVPSLSTKESAMNVIETPVAPHPSSESSHRQPLWTRADLEEMSHGQISRFFGPQFKAQDRHARQVRMPMPPLLLADRVMDIQGEPGAMGLGRIVTETDITADAWYLHQGCMPAGLEVEAGQADLLLISYLGADLLNQGERVYRLLGCEMTYHGDRRPRSGDVLRYEIEVTGHARTGDIRLFFFRYDSYLNGQLRLSVRNGRAGFFTSEELENAGGVLWDPQSDAPNESIAHTPSPDTLEKRSFSRSQVSAFARGLGYECFGPGFEGLASHHRTPKIQDGRMQLFQEVAELDPRGGPWGRGYLRATYQIQGDEWFFPGHFHNDPTMPGTLMCEAGIQMMSFYLAALGHTTSRDGWTFELMPSTTFKATCRGQVTPQSREMTYEIFIRGLELGDCPTLWADVLLTVDGRKAFHGRDLGVRLWPDVPLQHAIVPLPAANARPAAQVDGFVFDGAAMLHCATGLPSLAFGPKFQPFDGVRNLPRLPSSPYQFMSRVTRCEGELGAMQIGSAVEIEYDIPDQAWYFDDNDGHTMPFAILLEAALQPCGWLAAYMGVPLHCETDLSFRNLDGDGTLLRPVYRGDGILTTSARCTSVARNGNTFIEAFEVECRVGDRLVYTLKTVFGHFTAEALGAQKGLAATADARQAMEAAQGAPIDLLAQGNRLTRPRLAHGQLLMLDRVTGYWPHGGAAARGRLLAQFDVDPKAWFFKAHFYRDPVQPGSLGIEAMVQLLQFYMRDRDLGAGMRSPRFEPLACGRPMAWKYRGQVLPKNRRVSVELEIVEEGRHPEGPWVSANAWLWVDGLRIYQAKGLTARIVEGDTQ